MLDEATSDLSHGGMRKMAALLYRYRPEASYLVIAHHLEPLLSSGQGGGDGGRHRGGAGVAG